ncbi:tRNA lysidine(34) synthetase TilS [Lactobacillus hominis]|uniref:tRNA lysidine(34) synthetase TilS n=1 Tax=Lactobacillus hominis TaxID=1203033 RepID=UPI0023F0A608|nr:tRNA lysidine(34) synthetase TilS [Lactobacillus hominis]
MKKLADFFAKNDLAINQKKFLIATSAGPDSMALLDMMRKLVPQPELQIVVGHVDHNLRRDSYLENELLDRYCQKYNLRIYHKKWAKDLQPQVGIEAAARKFRYDFFKEIIASEQIDYLLTAHHGDDLIENILLKFVRSGRVQEMNSLIQIGKFGQATVLRPLLYWSKQELEQYDEKNKIDFIQDQTNFEDDVLRNRIRHHIVPLLKKENSGLVKNAMRFLESEDELENDQSSLFSSIKAPSYFLDSITGNMADLSGLSLEQKRRYFEWLILNKWHQQVHFSEIDENIWQKDGFSIFFYRHRFFITKNKFADSPMQPIQLDKEFLFRGKKYLVSLKEKVPQMQTVGFFYNEPNLQLKAGSVIAGEKLELANDKQAKSKKKFAEVGIPKQLRNRCLAIKNNQQILFVEHVYQWQKFDKKYIRYNIFSNCEDSFK